MKINSSDTPWFCAAAGASAVATALYVSFPHPAAGPAFAGTWPGIAFGIAGSAAMLVAGALSLRKRIATRRIGSAFLWMRLHVWLGVLAIPLILFHSGFRLGGTLTTLLMLLFAVVSLSGLLGLLLQQLVPRMMSEQVPLEAPHSQIEHIRRGLAVNAYEIVSAITGALPEAADEIAVLAEEANLQRSRPGNWKHISRQRPAVEPLPDAPEVRDFYLEQVRPYLRRQRKAPFPNFMRLSATLPPELSLRLERLSALCEESKQLDAQIRLHALLHDWLLVHAPLSLTLFVLAAFHIYFALRY